MVVEMEPGNESEAPRKMRGYPPTQAFVSDRSSLDSECSKPPAIYQKSNTK